MTENNVILGIKTQRKTLCNTNSLSCL